MTIKVRPLIMCGGSGTRLWPVSRDASPKQFANLLGDRSTFQETLLRVSDADIFDTPLIIANIAHRFTIERQLKEIGMSADLLLEPAGRDSGPAIAAGSAFIAEHAPDSIILVLAADHLVRNVAGFKQTVVEGIEAANKGYIVTHGIRPSIPATGYGYIEAGEQLAGKSNYVKRFVEKPDSTTAAQYVLNGYFWNSGNFMFKASTLLKEYTSLDAKTVEAATLAVTNKKSDNGAYILDAASFAQTTKQSIDYAIMNHTKLAAIVEAQFDWSDIGSWDAMWDVSDKDTHGNVCQGNTKVLDAKNCYVSTDGALTTLIGVENLIVVATHDAILVADKSQTANVKLLVEQMKVEKRVEATEHPKVHRPWGWFQTRDLGSRFRVKRIVVYPGGRLSLQKHHHRAEHWVVVAGTADVTVGQTKKTLAENQSVYISLGEVHRLENPGLIDLEIIEVQTGSYLGEDDIIRLEDIYNRPETGI
jgi:mannose-1-phosphate guanylyltransferase / mannose-6-phosphate isomerase